MRDQIMKDLASHIDASVVADLIETYEQLVAKHRLGDQEAALTKAGRFVEHALRAIQFIRTGKAPAEIKSVAALIKELESDVSLSESLRFLIPRAAYGMIYNLRSKRDAVHVKEIDPRQIDGALAVASASWIVAEFLRLYHKSSEADVARCMNLLSRAVMPFIESIDGETFVGQNVPARVEVLLLLANASPQGLSRKAIGNAAKCSQPSVSKALSALVAERRAHQSESALYFVTAGGERELADWLAASAP